VKLLVGITGASGTRLGVKTALLAKKHGCEVGVIFTQNALVSAKFECETNLQNLLNECEIFTQIHESPASGSSLWEALAVVPCSTNSLAKISCGIADNLLTRTASVMLKERRKLLLAVREMPLHAVALKQMWELSTQGVMVAPPVFAAYSGVSNLDELENFFVGKFFDLLGVKNDLYKRWQSAESYDV